MQVVRSVPMIAAAAACLALGAGYLYRPDLLERFYAFLRDYLFNDAHLRLERRKWGLFFLLVSFLLFYLGMGR